MSIGHELSNLVGERLAMTMYLFVLIPPDDGPALYLLSPTHRFAKHERDWIYTHHIQVVRLGRFLRDGPFKPHQTSKVRRRTANSTSERYAQPD